MRNTILIVVLMLFTMASSVGNAIRYGFLVDAFNRRGIPGKVYGLLETSILLGFTLMYMSKGTQVAMKRKGHRFLFVVISLVYSAITLATGVVYLIDNNTAMMALSFVLRILLGAATYTSNLLPVDFIHAQFPDKFDCVNSAELMGFYCGHGVAESVGCLLYDRFGYVVPFVFSAILSVLISILLFFAFPDTETYLASQVTDKSNNSVIDCPDKSNCSNKDIDNRQLTWTLIFPMIVTMLINGCYGVLQVKHLYSTTYSFSISL